MQKSIVVFLLTPFFLFSEPETLNYPKIANDSEFIFSEERTDYRSFCYATGGVFGGVFPIKIKGEQRLISLAGSLIGFGQRFRSPYLGLGYNLDLGVGYNMNARHLWICPFTSLKGELLFYFSPYKVFHFLSSYRAQNYCGVRFGGGAGLFPKGESGKRVGFKKRPAFEIVLGKEEINRQGKVRVAYLGINLLDCFVLSKNKINSKIYFPVLFFNFSQEF